MQFSRFALAALLAGSLATPAQAQLLKNIKDKAAALQSGSIDIPLNRGSKAADTPKSKVGVFDDDDPALAKPTIFFDTTPPAEGTRPTRDKFVSSDNIYATIPLPVTLAEFVEQHHIEPSKNDGKLYLNAYISMYPMGPYESLFFPLRPEDMQKKVLTLDILPAIGKATTAYRITEKNSRPLSAVFLSLNGESYPFATPHQFELKVSDFRGVFSLTVPDKEANKALVSRIDKQGEQLDKALDMATELPAALKGPQGKFTDPGLNDAAVRKLLGPDLIRYVIEPGSSDYSVVYNSLGAPMRKVSRDVWAIYKDEDGMCVCAHVQFVRQHEGGGKYGAPTRLQHVQDNVIISCDKAK